MSGLAALSHPALLYNPWRGRVAKKHHTVGAERQPEHVVSGGRIYAAAGKIEPWFPWVLSLAYTLVLGYFTLRYHVVGGFGVETDFYAELVPQARKLLAGEFSPFNYGAKGPVYSFMLAAAYGVTGDYFRAGLILNLLSGAVFLVTVYYLVKSVFNALSAAGVTLAVAASFIFQSYTYQAASDLPFMALCALSMYFLFRDSTLRYRSIVLSALMGLLAFLMRYNGAFIPAGSLLFIVLSEGSVRERLKRAGIWLGVFAAAGLPWFAVNMAATGSPVHNDNYLNVMYEYYGRNAEGVTYENWTDALPKEFTGMADIILYDPGYFIAHTVGNIFEHIKNDLLHLTGLRLGVLTALGFIVFWFARPGRKKLLFFSFGVLYFLILTIVFYNPRFSLFLIVFYLILAVWPWTADAVTVRLKKLSPLPLAVIALVIASSFATSTQAVIGYIRNEPGILKDLRDLGLSLASKENDNSKIVIARKPHVASYAELEYRMFPASPRSVPELIAYCRENDVDYIVYSGVEAAYRPDVRTLFDISAPHPGLDIVVYNKSGVVYRVLPQ